MDTTAIELQQEIVNNFFVRDILIPLVESAENTSLVKYLIQKNIKYYLIPGYSTERILTALEEARKITKNEKKEEKFLFYRDLYYLGSGVVGGKEDYLKLIHRECEEALFNFLT